MIVTENDLRSSPPARRLFSTGDTPLSNEGTYSSLELETHHSSMAMVEEEKNSNPSTNGVHKEEEDEDKKVKEQSKEGYNLLGSPTFEKLENGRFKCVETGHELPEKEKESYAHSKRCRLGLIDSFLSKKKPPLNIFKQDPLCRSKVICKLTGVTVNKSEEHIWKHLNGRKFMNKLEQKETGTLGKEEEKPPKALKSNANGVKKDKKDKKKKKKKQQKVVVEEVLTEMIASDDKSDLEELDFWIPPVGSRWDCDDGKDRWGSDTESEEESYEGDDAIGATEENGVESAEEDGVESAEEDGVESEELSMRTKRMSIEIGPSSFASRKKKSKTSSTDPSTS